MQAQHARNLLVRMKQLALAVIVKRAMGIHPMLPVSIPRHDQKHITWTCQQTLRKQLLQWEIVGLQPHGRPQLQ